MAYNNQVAHSTSRFKIHLTIQEEVCEFPDLIARLEASIVPTMRHQENHERDDDNNGNFTILYRFVERRAAGNDECIRNTECTPSVTFEPQHAFQGERRCIVSVKKWALLSLQVKQRVYYQNLTNSGNLQPQKLNPDCLTPLARSLSLSLFPLNPDPSRTCNSASLFFRRHCNFKCHNQYLII